MPGPGSAPGVPAGAGGARVTPRRWRSRLRGCMAYRMTGEYVLSDYLEEALAAATYDKLEDGTFAGRIPPCAGVVAFGTTLIECERSLRSTLEDWLLLGLRLGHPLPVIGGVDLNRDPSREPLGTA